MSTTTLTCRRCERPVGAPVNPSNDPTAPGFAYCPVCEKCRDWETADEEARAYMAAGNTGPAPPDFIYPF